MINFQPICLKIWTYLLVVRTDTPGQETVLKFIIHGSVHMVGLGIFCKFTLIPQRNAEVFVEIQSLGDGQGHGIPLP